MAPVQNWWDTKRLVKVTLNIINIIPKLLYPFKYLFEQRQEVIAYL